MLRGMGSRTFALTDVPGKGLEASVPCRPHVLDPLGRVAERRRLELVTRLPAAALGTDDPGGAKGREVLGNGLAGHRELLGELALARASPCGETFHDEPPARVGECAEDAVYVRAHAASAVISSAVLHWGAVSRT